MTDPETVRKGQLMEKYADAVSEEIRTSLRDAVPQLRLVCRALLPFLPAVCPTFDFQALSCALYVPMRSYCTRPGLIIVHCPPTAPIHFTTPTIKSILVTIETDPFQCNRILGTGEIPQNHRLVEHCGAVPWEDSRQIGAPVRWVLGSSLHETKDCSAGVPETNNEEQRHFAMVCGGRGKTEGTIRDTHKLTLLFYRRPHNKSPSDQCRPYIMDILNGKHHFLNQYLEGQQAKLIEVGSSFKMINLL